MTDDVFDVELGFKSIHYREGDRDRGVQKDGGDPADLRDGNGDGVGEARRAVLGILLGRA